MKASDILLDGFDYSQQAILDWELVDSNVVVSKNTTALVDTSASTLELTLPPNPLENDEVRVIDAKGTFDVNNLTLSSDDKIMESDDNIVLDKQGTYMTLVYINDSYGWKYNMVNVKSIAGVPVNTSGIDNNYIMKYDSATSSFIFEQVEPLSTAPSLTGDTSGYEGTDATVTIQNYNASNTYDVNIEGGSYVRTGNSIVWTLPEVTTSTDKDISVTVTEPGKSANASTWTVTVDNIVGDDAIVYTNDCEADYPEFQTGFAFTDGENQDVGDEDWVKAQPQMTVVNPEQFTIAASGSTASTLLVNAPATDISNGDVILTDVGGNLAETTVGNVAMAMDAKQQSAFQTVTYTGNGTEQSITGVGFKPDLVWMKSRTQITTHRVYDSNRGARKRITPNDSSAETYPTTELQSFDSDGFTMGSTGGGNGSGESYVAWCWKADNYGFLDNGSGLPQTEKYSTESGLSIIKYEGNGIAGRTIKHSLGSVPKRVIIKCLSATGDWIVRDVGLSNQTDGYLSMTSNAIETTSSTMWNSTAPDSTNITVGTNSAVNQNGYDYIAYVFNDVSDFAKFGEYTGDGVSGLSINVGFEPSYVMIKGISGATGSWIIFDKERVVSGDEQQLWANSDNAEGYSSTRDINFTSTGFDIIGTDQDVNNNAEDYIYMAFSDEIPAPQLTLTSLTPALSAVPSYIYKDNNTMYLTTGAADTDIEAKKLGNISQSNFDGTSLFIDGETVIEDELNKHPISVIGATISSAEKKFGTSSIYFDAPGQYLSIPSSDEFSFDGDFTIDGWVNSTTDDSDRIICLADNDEKGLQLFANGAVYYNNSYIIVGSGGIGLNDGTWKHFALVRCGSIITYYVDGVVQGTLENNDSMVNPNGIMIGRWFSSPVGDKDFDGYMDNIRITKGKALFTENFDPNELTYDTTSYDLIGTLPTSGAISASDTIVVDGEDYTVNSVTSETSKRYVNNGFKTVTYVGDQQDRRSVYVGFQPDMVWIKNRDSVYTHRLYDSLRGVTKQIEPSESNVQNTTNGLQEFTGDGFVVGVNTSCNRAGDDIVAWCWSAPKSCNCNGVEEKFNDKTGFSMIKYAGNGTAGREIQHSLGKTPKFVIVKNLTTALHWCVYSSEIGATKYLELDESSAEQTATTPWNNTEPTDEYITLGSSGLINETPDDYIMYVFAEIPGMSSFGSYTGNESTTGPVIDCGFRPAYLMVKNTVSNQFWYVYDNKRDVDDIKDKVIYPNSSDAETTTTTNEIKFLDNGFQPVNDGTGTNGSGNKIIYIAFSESEDSYEYKLDLDTTPEDPTEATLIEGYSEVTRDSLSNYDNPEFSDTMNTVLYTGTGAEQSIEGVGFQPDLVWIKVRDGSNAHQVIDSVRVSDKILRTNDTSVEETNSSLFFNTDGFSLISSINMNYSALNYVAWCWKADENGYLSNLEGNSNARFSAVTYTGDGTAGHEITGFGFQPDLVWIKNRTGTNSHQLIDSIRGVTNVIFSDSTADETISSTRLQSFDPDGFTTGVHGGVNASGGNYIAWGWQADVAGFTDNGAGQTQVEKYSLASGLSIIKYSGNSTAGRTLKHSLGSVPQMIIVKNLDTAKDWMVNHVGLSDPTAFLRLNTSVGVSTGSNIFDGTHTDTEIILGSADNVNITGDNYICYIFSEVSGNSSFGSYTGNNNTTGPVVSTGFRPDFLMIKRTDTVGDWCMYDTKRDNVNPNTLRLWAHTPGAEADNAVYAVDINETDFQIKGLSADFNASGGTYIYMAFGANQAGDSQTEKYSTESGLSIIKYTGNGQAGRVVKHSLGKTPSMVICKNLDDTDSWAVYHKSLGATGLLNLNSTSAFTTSSLYWNDTNPISNQVTLGTGGGVNGNGEDIIMYVFSEIAGTSSFGSYTGNGSTTGPVINCGFKPVWVMVKRTDAAYSWFIFDIKRNPDGSYEDNLYADLSNAEASANAFANVTDTGFSVDSTNAFCNTNGGNYIYIAFAGPVLSTPEFKQIGIETMLPADTRQIGTAIKLTDGESVKDTSINVWKS